MPNPNAGFLGEGNYSNRANAQRAERRALARLEGPVGLERIQGFEVIKPEPNSEWSYEAKMVWTMASNDEATLYWSSGDWMHLYLACDYLHRANTDPRKHTPSAQAMTVIMDTLKSLKLTETAKRANGIIINRDEVVLDETDEWLNNVIQAEFQKTETE